MSKDIFFFVFIPMTKIYFRRRGKNKKLLRSSLVELFCKSPCGEQRGKALSEATIGSVVANPPPSAKRNKKMSKDIFFFVFIPMTKIYFRRRGKNKKLLRSSLVELFCKSPCGEQRGKALSEATIGSVVANPPPSAEEQKVSSIRHLLFCI